MQICPDGQAKMRKKGMGLWFIVTVQQLVVPGIKSKWIDFQQMPWEWWSYVQCDQIMNKGVSW